MQKTRTLILREWLQHRFGWAMMALIPVALLLAVAPFGQIKVESDAAERAGDALPTLIALGSVAGMCALIFLIVLLASSIVVVGLARRDHADRSIEFWLSLPAGPVHSLAVPLGVHLLLAPAAAVLVGLAGGYALSALLVTRIVDFQSWLALPWADFVPATLAFALRLLAGLPLMALWLSPLLLATMLLTAWFRRWGWIILVVGVGVGSQLLKLVLGQPWLSKIVHGWLTHAATALFNGGAGTLEFSSAGEGLQALNALPAWLLRDFGFAVRELASPLFAGAMLFAALCFVLLVQWRQRGAGAAS